MAVPADDRGVVQSSNRFGSASDEDMNDILTDLNAKNTERGISNATGYLLWSGIFAFDNIYKKSCK
jgi:hypothetical protein